MADYADRAVAQVCRAARDALTDGLTITQAADRVRTLTTDPRLLGLASGLELGAWLAAHRPHETAPAVVEVLDTAGADIGLRDEVATDLVRRASAPLAAHPGPCNSAHPD